MPPISVLIKPASGNCNLRCEYCFYYDTMSKRTQSSYGFMPEETLEAVIKQVLAYAEGECTIAYQGGEPTLRGLPFFIKSMEYQEKYNVNHVRIYNSIQTNGYAIDKEWADFFAANHFLVGVSLDGTRKVHDAYRHDIRNEGSFYKVMDTIEFLKRRGVEFNVLSVVNALTAPQIEKIYRFFQKNDIRYLQFIACLNPLNECQGLRDYSLTPEVYGKFLIDLFGLWYQDLKEGKQTYIRQFENYVAMLLGHMPESCDMRGFCGMQYVVEADGSVYPCDFYVLDEYRLGNFKMDTVEDIDAMRRRIGFVEQSLYHGVECQSCKYHQLCRGGCRRNRTTSEPVHQYFCQSYQMFFDACLPRLREIANRIRVNT